MKKIFALALVLCLALSAMAVATAEATPAKGGTLTVGLNIAPVTNNVWYASDLNTATITYLACPPLVTFNEDGVKYNYLAESSSSNEDATEWTVTIKEELTWSDGTPVTGEDLLFTAQYGTEHHIGFFDSYYGDVDFEKSTVDGKTVNFVLTTANVNFWNGAGYWIPVMQKSEWETVEDPTTYFYSGNGYGPYTITEWVDGEYVVLERNPYFTLANDGEGAYIDTIIFRVYSDENAMVLALQNGEIDVCGNFLSVSSLSSLQGNEHFQIESVASLGYAVMAFSMKNEALADYAVRKAIAMCADREALVNIAFAGGATAMYTPVSPVYSNLVEADIQQPAFDTEGAAALLEENGYVDADGDGIREAADGSKLSFTITYKTSLANVDAVMSIMNSNMAAAGIELVLQPVDAATYSANVTQGHDFDIAYLSWGTIDDVDTTLLTCFGIGQTLNFMDFNSEEQEALLRAMQGTVDQAERIALLDQWQQWFVENLPCVHLFVPNNTYAACIDNFEGWSLTYGNSAFLDASHIVNVYAK